MHNIIKAIFVFSKSELHQFHKLEIFLEFMYNSNLNT